MSDSLPDRAAFPASTRPWTVRRANAPRMPILPPLDVRYHVCWIDADGAIDDFHRMGPALPLFTEAFCAVVRGALVQTVDGQVAVEDLLPGTRIITADGAAPLKWKGDRTILPQTSGRPLFRIPSEALGPGRPMPDLVLGMGARLVSRRTILRSLMGVEAALVPVAALADGQSVIEIMPISAVQVFHLGFERHTTFTVNGLEIESVHPGRLDPALGSDLQGLYMSMFPHLGSAEDFGRLAIPRAEDEILDRLSA